jgi:hypothetical protein
MKVGKFKEKFYKHGQPISQSDKERRQIAIEIAKNHKDIHPIKFLLKR